MTDDQRARFESLESSYGYLSNAVDGGSNVSRGSASVSSQRLRDADVQRSLRVPRADVGDTKAVNEEMSAALSDSAEPPCLGSSVSRMRAYDVSKCMARTTGKKQCQRARVRNSEFCAQHKKTAATGMFLNKPL